MAELKTRISLKYDTLANWQKSTLKLNKGELAIAVIPTADPANKQLPPVMFKVGDGEHTFAELGDNWASALAADVYGWAKAATRPAYKYGDADLTGFGTAAAKNVGDFDKAGAAAIAETNAKAYVDEKIGAIPAAAEYTLETGTTDGSLVLKKDGVAVGDPAVVKGWAELLAKAQKGIDDAAAAKKAADAAQKTADGKYTLPEGGIPKTTLDADVQASLDKADSALQSHQTITTGTANGTIAVAGKDVAVKGLGSAAYTASTAYDAAGTASTAVSNHNSSTSAHADIREEIQGLSEKLSGRTTNYVYKNKDAADYKAAIAKAGSFIVGDTIYFEDDNISDQWVVAVNNAAPFYTFKDIETEHPSFDGYVKGTGLTANKIVLGNAGSNVKASTCGIADATNVKLKADDDANLPTSKAVADYVGSVSIAQSQVTGLADALAGKQASLSADQLAAANSGITADKVTKYDGYASGKQNALNETQLAAVNSGITADKVGVYDGYADGKQDTISATNKLSADFISGLGAAAKKGVDATVSATSENLPTSKAVASYVGGEIDKISIPTVNNAALKDASGATIFTANASEDVQILVIDCGNASGWEA